MQRTSVPPLHTLFQGKRPGFDRVIQHLLICLLLLTTDLMPFAYAYDMPPTFLLQTGPKKCGKIITNVEKIGW
jgi:hypothetical protein